MDMQARQGRKAKGAPKLRGTPQKLRIALRQEQAKRDKRLEEMEKDPGDNMPSRSKPPRGQEQNVGRSEARANVDRHTGLQADPGQCEERLEIRLGEARASIDGNHQGRPPAPATSTRQPSLPIVSPPQSDESASELESDDNSSSDDERPVVKRKSRPRAKLSRRQKKDLLVEFVAREDDYLAALANGAPCHRDMPFWSDIRKRLGLERVSERWSGLSRAFVAIVGPRQRQAMEGKKVRCKGDFNKLIERCARIRIRREILEGFAEDNLLELNMVPELIRCPGSLEQVELILGEEQYLSRQRQNKEVQAEGGQESVDNSEEDDDDSDESSDSSDSSDYSDIAGEPGRHRPSSPPTSPISASPRRLQFHEPLSPVSTAAATFHTDNEVGKDYDDSLTIEEEIIAFLECRRSRKRRLLESREEDVRPSRRIRMQQDIEDLMTKQREDGDMVLRRWRDM